MPGWSESDDIIQNKKTNWKRLNQCADCYGMSLARKEKEYVWEVFYVCSLKCLKAECGFLCLSKFSKNNAIIINLC